MLCGLEKRRSFEYREVDVMADGQKEWRDLYEFDTPVVHPLVLSFLNDSWRGLIWLLGLGLCSAHFPHLLET